MTKTTKKEQTKNGNIEDFRERLAQASQLLGFQQQRIEPAPNDEEYAVFASGEYASKQFKRIPKPSYRQQEKVAHILITADDRVYEPRAKQALCAHHGIDESDMKDELSQKQVDEAILPLICRDLPEQWDIGDVASAEVARMRRDFLLDT